LISMQNENYIVCFGEVLIDNLPHGRRLGGAPLNVCYHLNKSGFAAIMVSQVGDDDLGRELLERVLDLGVDPSFIDLTSQHPSSSVEVEIDQEGNTSYDIVGPVAWDALTYSETVAKLISRSAAFVFGSLVARSASSRETLFRYLDSARWPVFDVNLRPPFVEKELILDLIGRCKTLKVNEEELNSIACWLSPDVEGPNALGRLFNRYPNLQEILLTRGAKGAVYKNRTEETSRQVEPIKVKDTVGAGDAFLAGFLARKFRGAAAGDALTYAIALGSYVATQSGACPEYPASLR
jgi:fructokinase